MRVLVVSRRALDMHLAEACTMDLEDAVVDSLEAELFRPELDLRPRYEHYDLIFVASVSVRGLWDTLRILRRLPNPPKAHRKVGYLFGAYGRLIRKGRIPLRRLIWDWRREFRYLDRLYLGIPFDVDQFAADLGVPTRYLPMAANALMVDARPLSPRHPRAIDVNAFGRQYGPVADAICDRFNAPGSERIIYRTGLVGGSYASDIYRYRSMFWQLLRNSRVSLAFDQTYSDAGRIEARPYIGPRWFESLAAGAVVVGRSEHSAVTSALIDWPDALINLPEEPGAAVDALDALLDDEDRLHQASCRNTAEIQRRHDWRHRIVEILEVEGLGPRPTKLTEQLALLESNADRLTAGANTQSSPA